MRIIAVANQKGGCGKTTTSINFAACLAFLQKKVLLIDVDPQGHSSVGLGIRAEKLPFTLYDLLSPREENKPQFSAVACEISPNFFLIPSHNILSAIEEELASRADRNKYLGREIDRLTSQRNDFDFVVLDCPPNLGILTSNSLEAADEVLIPIEPSFFSLHGLAKISETLQGINQKKQQPLLIHALLTIFDSRTLFAQEVYEEVNKHFGERLLRTIIHESVTFKEAASAGQSIVQYDHESTAFRDYFNLAVEYLEREWNRLLPEEKLGWNNLLANRYGPRRVIGGILFQFVSKSARCVEIAGDFNHWIPENLVARGENGLWQKVLPMAKGSYRYKFIVDGEWQVDPDYPIQRENAYGTLDSYLELA